MRCLFRERMTAPNPLPGLPPSTLDFGTRQSLKYTSDTGEPSWPIFLCSGPTDRPGVPRSTRKHVVPEPPRFDGSVRVSTVKRSAIGALVM